jgi:AraC-like DNA-binding protein
VLLFDIRALARMMEELQVSLPAFTDNGKSRLRIVKRPDVSAFGLDRLLMDVVCREENEPYRQLMILARLVELAVGVDKLMANHPRALPEPDKHNRLVADVVAYIDSHLSESLRLEALAEHFYVSTSTLCHKFSAEMHISPARYITLKRMYHAARLLREGYSATEAARMAGYENYVSFFYNYKKLMGVSPTGEPERERQ